MVKLREVFRDQRLYIGHCLGICIGVSAAVDNLLWLIIFAVCFMAVSYWIGD